MMIRLRKKLRGIPQMERKLPGKGRIMEKAEPGKTVVRRVRAPKETARELTANQLRKKMNKQGKYGILWKTRSYLKNEQYGPF